MLDINWDKIKQEFPEAYNLFMNHYGHWNGREYLTGACYCDLEEFFDKHKIIINIWFACYRFIFEILWNFGNYDDNKNGKGYNTRPEAQQQAIYKAFEILNNELKKITMKKLSDLNYVEYYNNTLGYKLRKLLKKVNNLIDDITNKMTENY